MIWALACGGWALALCLIVVLRSRHARLADVEHELRGAATGIGLASERLGRSAATRALAPLVALQLDRIDAALVDLGRARRLLPAAPCETGAPSESGIDVARLSQAVANLVDNAAEHGGGQVAIRWSASGLELRNRNAARGRHGAVPFPEPGRGRGLAIATRAARDLGGSLRVESDDEFTVATLSLPAPDRSRAA